MYLKSFCDIDINFFALSVWLYHVLFVVHWLVWVFFPMLVNHSFRCPFVAYLFIVSAIEIQQYFNYWINHQPGVKFSNVFTCWQHDELNAWDEDECTKLTRRPIWTGFLLDRTTCTCTHSFIVLSYLSAKIWTLVPMDQSDRAIV
jgi:hypothetical protein